MIDKELRLVGVMAKLVWWPSKLSLKIANFLSNRVIGQNLHGFDCDQVYIDRSDSTSTIRTRIYKPLGAKNNLPIMLFIHGGGYAMGTPEANSIAFKHFMKIRDCIVVAPAYRNSLEAPYPAAINDCYDALVWLKNNAEKLGGRSDQIIVCGQSAGGGLTLATCLMARDRKEVNIAFQLPLYPMIDDRQNLPSAVNNTAPVWNSKINKIGWALYLKDLHAANADIPAYAAPSRAESYAGLPPAITYVGDVDPFLDETKIMVERMRADGVAVEFEVFAGAYHGFEAIVPKAKISKAAHSFLKTAYSHAIDQHFAPQTEDHSRAKPAELKID